MKLQHNSSGESSEDLIALIIAVRREGKESMKRRRRKEKEGSREEESGKERGSDVIEEPVREPDVAGVIQVCVCLHVSTS